MILAATKGKTRKVPAGGAVSPARRAMIAKAHIAKKELLGGDDAAYRDCLRACSDGRADSAAGLTDRELHEFLRHCETLGWRPKRARAGGQEAAQRKALLAEIFRRAPGYLGENWAARLAGLCRGLCGVERVGFVKDPEQLRRLLKVLAEIARKEARA